MLPLRPHTFAFLVALSLGVVGMASAHDGVGRLCAVGLPGLKEKDGFPLSPDEPDIVHVPGTGFRIVIVPTARLAAQPQVLARIRIAAARWEAIIANDTTVSVAVDYGPDFFGSVAFPQDVLAFTNPRFANSLSLTEMQNVLRIAGAPQLSDTWNLLPEPQIPVESGQPRAAVKPTLANAQALQLTTENDGFAAELGINSASAWDFDPANGIDIDRYDFDALVVHELGHALGFVTAVSPDESTTIAPLDYYRTRPGAVSQPGDLTVAPRVLTPGPTDRSQVFNAGWGDIPFSTGDGPNGGDHRNPSHWRDEDLAPFQVYGIMKPTFFPHERSELQENDVRALQAIGYSVRLPLTWTSLELPNQVDLGYILPDREFTVQLPFWNRGMAAGRVSLELVSYENNTPGNPTAALGLSRVALDLAPGEWRAVAVQINTLQVRGGHRAVLRFHTNDKAQPLRDVEVLFNVSDNSDQAGWVLY